MEYWYTLYTKPNAEFQVERALQQRDILVYLPKIERSGRRSGQGRQPFFPCYLFAKIDLEVVGLSHMAWIPGLRRVLSFGERPVAVPDAAIELIRAKLEGVQAAGGWPAQRFRPGDVVRITAGPLQDMLAVFDRPTTPGERVQVLLSFLGQVSRASVPVALLDAAPAGAQVSQPERRRGTRGQGRRVRYRDDLRFQSQADTSSQLPTAFPKGKLAKSAGT